MINLKSPISVVWEITNNCNYKCPHCRAFQDYTKDNVNIENKIVDEIIKSEIFVVNLSGGEPLLNKRIFDIAKKLTNNNVYVVLSTNGFYYEKYREKIKNSGIKFVQISLDGPEEIHEKFRGISNSFEKAINALKMAKDDGLRTQMNVTITSSNLDTLEWNYEKAKELGIDRVFYRRVVPYGKAKLNRYVLPDKQIYYDKLKKLYRLSSDKLKVVIDDPILGVLLNESEENHLSCGAGINSLGISSDGEVYPCIFLREKIGNIMDKSIMDMWNNSEILIKLRNREIQKCGNCKYKFSCGGCRAFSGIYEDDAFCPL